MSIVDRVRNICLSPATEWPVIAGEETTTGALLSGYAAPLAAIGAVAGFIGGSVIGRSVPFTGTTFRVPFFAGIGMAIFAFVMALVAVFVLSLIIDFLAPTFGGQKSSIQAMKLAVYSYTPAWVAGVLQILPFLGILGLLAGLYGIYLLYLGLPKLMKNPEDKSVGYTAVVMVCAIVLYIVIGSVSAGVMGAAALGGALTGVRGSSEVEFDEDSPLGRLQELGRQMEQGADRMEEAQESGDSQAQMDAAMDALGTLLGGGSRVDPVSVDTIKGFVPATLGDLAQTSSNVERTGMAGIMIAKAEATYGDGVSRQIELEITDTGGMSGIMGLASWVASEGEREDDTTSERTRKVNGRLTHEKVSKTGGANEFGLVIADRFMVSATGQGVDLDGLKAAVASLDLSGLENLTAQ
jgi:hypothetical protein